MLNCCRSKSLINDLSNSNSDLKMNLKNIVVLGDIINYIFDIKEKIINNEIPKDVIVYEHDGIHENYDINDKLRYILDGHFLLLLT